MTRFRNLAALLLGFCACSTTLPGPRKPVPLAAHERIREADRLRRSGHGEEAKLLYEEVVGADPAATRAHVGLQVLGAGTGEDLALRRQYRAGADPFLAGRLEPAGKRQREAYAAAAEPWRSLGLGMAAAAHSDLSDALAHLARAQAMDAGFTWARLSQGRLLLAAGKLGQAALHFDAARWTEPEHPMPYYGLSLIADRRGHLARAFAYGLEAYRRAPAEHVLGQRLYHLARRSRHRVAQRRAADLLARQPGVARLWAASLYRQLGQIRKVAVLRKLARKEGVSERELAALDLPRLAPKMQRFTDALRKGVEARYRHYAATREADSFQAFHAWARDLYERETGRTLGRSGKPQKFSFVGTLLDPARDSDAPLVRACADAGLLLVIGQRSGGPPEALLAEIVRRDGPREVTVRGGTVRREAVFLGYRYLGGYSEWAGGGDLAGLALDGLVLVELHAVANWEGSLRRRTARLAHGVLDEPALADTPVDSLDDPAGIATRLFATGRIDLEREVLVHEEAHLIDAARHLPVGRHAWRNLGLAVRRGLSTHSILAFLERNAQLAAIAEGETPRAALGVCCGALGGEGEHAAGYTEIVRGFVDAIHDHPEDYPGIDARRVILQQLHRLTDDQIRAIARDLMRRWDLLE